MPVEPSNDAEMRLRALRELGLTEYQAKAYAALLRLGKGTAAQVANVTDVPRNKLYPVMQQLNALGLVETTLGEAQLFRPLPLDRFLDERLQALRTQAEHLEDGRSALLRLFRAVPGEGDVAPAGYRLYHGRGNMLDQLRAALRDATHDVALVGTQASPPRLLAGGVVEALRERVETGVQVRGVFPADCDAALLRELDAAWGTGVLRVHPGLVPAAMVVVVDEHAAMLIQAQPDDPSITRGNDISLVTPSAIIARLLEHYASQLWEQAVPLPRPRAPQAP